MNTLRKDNNSEKPEHKVNICSLKTKHPINTGILLRLSRTTKNVRLISEKRRVDIKKE